MTTPKLKISIYDILLSKREIELPNVCPNCHKSIRAAGLKEERLVRELQNILLSDPVAPYDSEGNDPFDTALRGPPYRQRKAYVIGYACGLCDTTLVKGAGDSTCTSAVEVIESLRALLWPNGDADNEWDAETLDGVAAILHKSGYGIK